MKTFEEYRRKRQDRRVKKQADAIIQKAVDLVAGIAEEVLRSAPTPQPFSDGGIIPVTAAGERVSDSPGEIIPCEGRVLEIPMPFTQTQEEVDELKRRIKELEAAIDLSIEYLDQIRVSGTVNRVVSILREVRK